MTVIAMKVFHAESHPNADALRVYLSSARRPPCRMVG